MKQRPNYCRNARNYEKDCNFGKRWSHVLVDVDDVWILTLLIGGVAQIDVSIRLIGQEIRIIKDDPTAIDEIVKEVQKNRGAYSDREIHPSIWP